MKSEWNVAKSKTACISITTPSTYDAYALWLSTTDRLHTKRYIQFKKFNYFEVNFQ